MSLPSSSALIASGSCSHVYFVARRPADVPELVLHVLAVRGPGRHGRQVAQHHGVEVLRVEGLPLAVPGAAVYSLSNASGAAPARTCPTDVPRMPSVASAPGVLGSSLDARPSVMNVLLASQLPVRTSAGPTLAYVSGKSTIT